MAGVAVVAALSYHREWDLDISSGRIRDRQVMLRATVWSSIRETDFSRMARPLVDPTAQPQWKWAGVGWPFWNPFGLFVNCRYGHVAAALQSFVHACRAWDLEQLPPEVREQAIRDVFACLASDDELGMETAMRGFDDVLSLEIEIEKEHRQRIAGGDEAPP